MTSYPHRLLLGALLCATLSLGGCASLGFGPPLSGTLEADGAVTLPAGARARVELVDIAQANERRAVVSTVVLDDVTALPVRFAFDFDDDRVSPKRPYAVRAEVVQGDTLLYLSRGTIPVLTGGHPNRVVVRLLPAR